MPSYAACSIDGSSTHVANHSPLDVNNVISILGVARSNSAICRIEIRQYFCSHWLEANPPNSIPTKFSSYTVTTCTMYTYRHA
jgi:hypothetical protein